jgi:murein DD-endopeptidase MepM/ murein hydrolase activator NlpD
VKHHWAIAVLAVLVGFASPRMLFSAAQKHAVHKTSSAATVSCGANASLTLSATGTSQGSLILAELSGRTPVKSVVAKWGTEEIAFWPSDAMGSAAVKTQKWLTLLAIDLEKPPGEYPIDVTVQPKQGAPATCQLTIHVISGKFPTENLHVAPQFVEPNPEQLERAKKEQQRLREIYATVTPEKLWQGRFRVPLEGVTSGANFGRRRVLNGQPGSPHSGVDFPAPTGTPVHAAQDGRVVLAEALFFAGNTVIVDHGFGIYTLYGHLSEISAKVGDNVQAGEVLGKVGATGRVTGPHLHWGLSVDRSRVNALQIVNLPQI